MITGPASQAHAARQPRQGTSHVHAFLCYPAYAPVVVLAIGCVQLQPGGERVSAVCQHRALGRPPPTQCSSLQTTCAASGLAGLAQLGSVSSDWMEVRMEQMLWQGLQWSWMMSKHRVPSEYTCSREQPIEG